MTAAVTDDGGDEGTDWSDVWEPRNAALLTLLALDSLLTIFCVIIVASCVMCSLNRRQRRKEERDKIGRILRDHYWDSEEQIARVMQVRILLKYLFSSADHQVSGADSVTTVRYCLASVFVRTSSTIGY